MLRLASALRLPGSCAVCAAWSGERFCADCQARYAAAAPRCRRCALRLAPGARDCGECLSRPLQVLDATITAVDYAFPWDTLVARFKFHDGDDLAAPLAALLQRAVDATAPAVDWIVPVPLSGARLRERGYNQAWELARRLRCGAARHAPRLLRRRFDTPHQSGLSRPQRHANLRGAFEADPAAALRGRSVALVDDVMTSGATLAEAALTLRSAGAASVQAWVLARTPLD